MSARIARSTRPRTSVLSFATNLFFSYQIAARFGVHSGTGCFFPTLRFVAPLWRTHSCAMSLSGLKQHAVPMVRHLEGQRSHECERGTHECARHNDFNILRGLTKN